MCGLVKSLVMVKSADMVKSKDSSYDQQCDCL